MRRLAWQVLGLGLAAFFAWLALRHVDWDSFVAAMSGVAAGWVVCGLGFLALGYGCRILRWRGMLRAENPDLSLRRCSVALVASIAVNNLLPFRAGDVLRCVGFSAWLNVPPGPIMASVLAERLFDLVVLILGLGLALWAFSLGDAALQSMSIAGSVMGLIGLLALVLLLAPRVLSPVLRGGIALARVFGARAGDGARAVADDLSNTLARLARRGALGALLYWTTLVWAFEGATYWAIAQSLPALPTADAAWLAMPMGTLATMLPSTPGHVGTFDYFAQWAMIAAGNPIAAATAFVLLVHVTLWLATTLVGGVCLAIWAQAGGFRQRPHP